MRLSRALAVLALFAALSLPMPAAVAQDAKLQVQGGDTVKSVLQGQMGKRVSLVLVTGPGEIAGVVDGGYYTKTEENRFLAGPLPVEGAYVIGALSGYGLMAANGAADLLADHVAGRPLPDYAPAFALDRYDDPAYRASLAAWGDSGQL